jgi:peptidoglycan/LPS O-acetylase OafA/YrhL
MQKGFSIYLDLVRLIAALLVAVSHSNSRLFTIDRVPLSSYGHEAVVVFFVLSGYVIAYVAKEREKNWQEYSASRFARIFSLALPVVLITPILDTVGTSIDPSTYIGNTTQNFALLRIVTSLLFANEVWGIAITTFSNVPYWSLCYEVWYYVAFAIFLFAPRQYRWALILAIAALLGPKVVLLAPIWIAGVLLFRFTSTRSVNTKLGFVLVLTSLIGFWIYEYFQVAHLATAWLKTFLKSDPHKILVFSKHFISDYFLCVFVVLHFAGMNAISSYLFELLSRFANPIKTASSATFALYLCHQPLLWFWAAVFKQAPSWKYWCLIMFCTLMTIAIFTPASEKFRAYLKQKSLKHLLAIGSNVGIEAKRH